MRMLIVAADRVIDGQGNHSETERILTRAEKHGYEVSELEIVSLAKRWEDKLQRNQFKSGASAMAALERARKLLSSKTSSVISIKGSDFLRTGYDRKEREKFMKLYSGKYTPLDGYTKLVKPFLKHHEITEKQFFETRDALFENYLRTWKRLYPDKNLPDERWFQPITKYFRGVDCANPNIDYSGQIVVMSEEAANELNVPKKKRIEVLGNAFTKLNVDGYESIPVIAPYDHLKRTLNKALKEAQIDFNSEYLAGRALIEAYTCYPVVPMALIMKLGLISDVKDFSEFLKDHEITITGGLNLAKAAWNLTSLGYIIEMREKLLSSKQFKYGLVHGNGSLGNQQGITILGRY